MYYNTLFSFQIVYGGKYDKEEILRLIQNQIAPQEFNAVSYAVFNNDAVFYVDNFKTARMLSSANRKIVLSDGHYVSN